MPTARSATATAAFGRRISVAGGEVPTLLSVNEVYDIATNTWSCQAPMPVPRHGVAAVPLDDRILVPAGGIVQGLNATNHVDSFIPAVPVPGVATWSLPAFALLLWAAGVMGLRRKLPSNVTRSAAKANTAQGGSG